METVEKRPVENEMLKREIKKAVPPYKRICKECGRKTLDEHETICMKCGATTKEVE
jgi:rRNA maturation endonuclease Nob1